MHARFRNGPGNGYRSNAIGMAGMAAASRVSPEGSMRGHRMYNSEHRSYNRSGGYGRVGVSKSFQPPQHPREPDIFMEAGKLAAEYLVSKGVLPANVLSGKWQNEGLKNQVGGFQGVRSREVENTQIPVDGRPSAHSRLGLDIGPGRRRYSDEFNLTRSSNTVRDMRRTLSLKSYSSETNKELVRSVSSAERNRASPGMEADGDTTAAHRDVRPVSTKIGNEEVHNSSSGEITQEGCIGSRVVSELEKHEAVEDMGSESSSFSNVKNVVSDSEGKLSEGKPTKECNDLNKCIAEAEVVREEKNDHDLEEKHDETKELITSPKDGILVNENALDLVKHSRFANVPTKVRTSLTIKGSKSVQVPTNEAENSDREISKISGVNPVDVAIDSSTGNASTDLNHELKTHQPDAATMEKQQETTEMTVTVDFLRSDTVLERSVKKEQEPDAELSGFSRTSSMFWDKGSKRRIDGTDAREDSKRLKQWFHPMAAQLDGSSSLCSSIENHSNVQELRTSDSTLPTLSDDHKCLNIPHFVKDHASSSQFMEEKQLFPGSFKTCDLNLVGTYGINENHVSNSHLIFPSVTETGKDEAPIDVDLSMSNNCNLPGKSGKFGVDVNDIEVIDLENDSAPEDHSFSISQRRGDAVFSDLDEFSNTAHNANEIPDIQDGYGLMISELLENGSPNSSTARDLNSLHNHLGLSNTEGILGDDDSIFMSLEEIPISLLGPWEQPTQDYGKPF